MNPAALRNELQQLEPGGTVIVNADTFDERNLTKAGYDANPLDDGSLEGYTVYEVPMSSLTKEAVAPLGVKPRDADRSKNFFALGLISWMYTRPVEPTLALDQRASSARSRRCATPTWPRSRPATPSARPPSCSTTPTR